MRISHSLAPLALVAALSLALPAAAFAGQKGKAQAEGKSNKANKEKASTRPAKDSADKDKDKGAKGRGDDVAINRDDHRRVIHDYYTRESLPPGLAKREALPPGLRRQLQERGELPPGLQQRLTPVPSGLATRLPSVPGHYHRYFAGRDLIVVDTRTNRIVSIVPDVLR
jgi:hypothetical protein